MKYLIDTHVCLWAIADKKRLSGKVKEILEDPEQQILISPISFFEIAIKLKIGKLPEFTVTLPEFINSVHATGFELLPFKNEYLFDYLNFDFSPDHRDPFDRYLIALAYFEDIAIITKDEQFQQYANMLDIIW